MQPNNSCPFFIVIVNAVKPILFRIYEAMPAGKGKKKSLFIMTFIV